MGILEEKEQKLLEQLGAICEELGWSVAIPTTYDDEDIVDGLVVGTPDFIDTVLGTENRVEDGVSDKDGGGRYGGH